MPAPSPTCLNCGAPLPPDAVSWGALECGRCHGHMRRVLDATRSACCSEGLHGDCRGERRGSCDCWCHGARRASNNPAGRPKVLAGGRRVQIYVDGETDAIVAARAKRDGVTWSEALRRIVKMSEGAQPRVPEEEGT